jgi:hypothetical protein
MLAQTNTRRGNLPLDLGGEPPVETSRTPVGYVSIHKARNLKGALAPKRGASLDFEADCGGLISQLLSRRVINRVRSLTLFMRRRDLRKIAGFCVCGIYLIIHYLIFVSMNVVT